jgi:hypothetical protein
MPRRPGENSPDSVDSRLFYLISGLSWGHPCPIDRTAETVHPQRIATYLKFGYPTTALQLQNISSCAESYFLPSSC